MKAAGAHPYNLGPVLESVFRAAATQALGVLGAIERCHASINRDGQWYVDARIQTYNPQRTWFTPTASFSMYPVEVLEDRVRSAVGHFQDRIQALVREEVAL